MTPQEAIEYNKNLREYMRITDNESECKFSQENYEALDMGNQALEFMDKLSKRDIERFNEMEYTTATTKGGKTEEKH